MGLLDSLGSGIKGLLGNPDVRNSLLTSLAVTGPNSEERMALLMRQKAIQEEAKKAEELRQLQLEAYRRQMAQEDKLQQKDDLTGAFIQSINSQVSDAVARLRESLASNDPAGAEKARKDLAAFKSPEAQMNYRTYLATQGNPEMAMQAGLIPPVQQEQATSKMREYEFARQNGFTGSFVDFMQLGQANAQAPASLQEWNAYNAMTPEQQKRFDMMKRGLQVFMVGGIPHTVDAAGNAVPLVAASEAAANAGTIESGKAQGRAAGEKAAGASGQIAQIDDAMQAINGLLASPGVDSAYGLIAGRLPTARQQTRDFEVERDRVVSILSLAARGQLAGTGPISNAEQDMLAKAQTILADPTISPPAARQEMNRLLAWLQSKRDTQSGMVSPVPGSSPSQTRRMKWNPQTGRLEPQ